MPIVDVTSPILDAYFKGVQLRQQKEQMLQAKQMEQAKMQQDQQQFERTQTALENHHRSQIDLQKAAQELQAKLHNAQVSKMQADIMREGYESIRKGNITPPQIRQDWARQDAPMVPGPISLPGGVTLDPSMYPTETEGTQMERATKMAEIAANREKERQDFQSKENDKRIQAQNERQEKLFAQQNSLLGQRLSQALEKTNPVNAQRVNNVAQQLTNSPRYKNYSDAQATMDKINATDPKQAPGVYDMNLMYYFVRGLDNSTVREGEVNIFKNAALSKLQKLGFGAKNIFTPAGFLTPQVRSYILNNLKSKFASAENQVKELNEAHFMRAKRLDPSLNKETWNSFTGIGTGASGEESEGSMYDRLTKGGKK